MTRIQRLAGQLKFGELDDCSVWYDDTRNALIIKDGGGNLVEFGDNLTDVHNAIRGYQFQQMRTVDLYSAGELPQGTVVDPSGAADDAVVAGGAASTASVGISISNPHAAGAVGPIVTVPGSVVDILLSAAGARGQYVATSAAGGTGTCQAGIPAQGRTIGMCIEATGGAGLARCIYMRM